jgi:hydrogenase maturation protease
MKRPGDEKVLLIGIGNAARQDDGLGWAFLEQVEQGAYFPGPCLYRFQLNLEDAELISHYDQVFFVDACRGELAGGFAVRACLPQAGPGFSTHLLAPEALLYLCQHLYARVPRAWLLAIQGYQWQVREGLCPAAQVNLRHALDWFQEKNKEWLHG